MSKVAFCAVSTSFCSCTGLARGERRFKDGVMWKLYRGRLNIIVAQIVKIKFYLKSRSIARKIQHCRRSLDRKSVFLYLVSFCFLPAFDHFSNISLVRPSRSKERLKFPELLCILANTQARWSVVIFMHKIRQARFNTHVKSAKFRVRINIHVMHIT